MQNDALLRDLATCGSAETLLAAILKHLPDTGPPVNVEAVAQSTGIIAFRDLDADGFASAVMADVDKRQGIILTAANLSAQRRRFAIAHQLGHFLARAQGGDRQCTRRDLSENRRDTPRRKEEMQANRFAAGLLMPKPWFVTFVEGLGKPTVAHVPMIAAAYDVSVEAAASRYVDLTPAMCALLFVKNGIIRYARPSRSFPALAISPGAPAPPTAESTGAGGKLSWIAADARDWLIQSRTTRLPTLTTQTLALKGALQLVMLYINAAAERRADEEAEKLATERPKFGR